ncbi:MAG: serine hydrolase domain-containing protein [Bacteroidota bacterium]
MKPPYLLLGALVLLLNACNTLDTNPERDQLETSLQAILEEARRGSFDQIAGVNMTVIAPELDLHWTGTSGFDSKEREDTIRAQQPFRIASITKTFVAAAMLRLVEKRQLSLEDPIAKQLPEEYLELLRQGGYEPNNINWRQCLNHTSGIYDYAMGGDTYVELARNNPRKRWTRKEQVELAMESGQATGTPGERYSYGDTPYILAGKVLEMRQDTNLGIALRNLLGYDKLGLESTWLESIEEAPPIDLPLVHCYFRNLDASNWDPSVDLYGGGGLVSTTQDLATFFHSLFNGKVFEHNETLDLMLAPVTYADTYKPEDNPRHKDYRLGLWKVKMFGEDAYMHGGLWSTGILHVPSLNCTIAVKFTNGWWERQVKQVILTIKNAQAKH